MSLSETAELVAFEQMGVGRLFRDSECFGDAAMEEFAQLSGDRSAIHTDREAARRFGFPDRLQYGFLLSSLLSRVVGQNFRNAICAAVSLDFVKPVFSGDRIEVSAEVAQIQKTMRSVVLRVSMKSGETVVARGKLTTIFLPEI